GGAASRVQAAAHPGGAWLPADRAAPGEWVVPAGGGAPAPAGPARVPLDGAGRESYVPARPDTAAAPARPCRVGRGAVRDDLDEVQRQAGGAVHKDAAAVGAGDRPAIDGKRTRAPNPRDSHLGHPGG